MAYFDPYFGPPQGEDLGSDGLVSANFGAFLTPPDLPFSANDRKNALLVRNFKRNPSVPGQGHFLDFPDPLTFSRPKCSILANI